MLAAPSAVALLVFFVGCAASDSRVHSVAIRDCVELAQRNIFELHTGEEVRLQLHTFDFMSEVQRHFSNISKASEFIGAAWDFASNVLAFSWSDVVFSAHTPGGAEAAASVIAVEADFNADPGNGIPDWLRVVLFIDDPLNIRGHIRNAVEHGVSVAVNSTRPVTGILTDAAASLHVAGVSGLLQPPSGFIHLSPFGSTPGINATVNRAGLRTVSLQLLGDAASVTEVNRSVHIRCHVNRLALRFPALALAGVSLYVAAPMLATSMVLYYSAGFGIGACGVVFVLILLLYVNRRNRAVIGTAVAATVAGAYYRVSRTAGQTLSHFGLSTPDDSAPDLLDWAFENGALLALGGMLLAGASVVLYLWLQGPVTNPRALRLMGWVFQGAALALVQQAFPCFEVGIAAVTLLFFHEAIIASLQCCVRLCPCCCCGCCRSRPAAAESAFSFFSSPRSTMGAFSSPSQFSAASPSGGSMIAPGSGNSAASAFNGYGSGLAGSRVQGPHLQPGTVASPAAVVGGAGYGGYDQEYLRRIQQSQMQQQQYYASSPPYMPPQQFGGAMPFPSAPASYYSSPQAAMYGLPPLASGGGGGVLPSAPPDSAQAYHHAESNAYHHASPQQHQQFSHQPVYPQMPPGVIHGWPQPQRQQRRGPPAADDGGSGSGDEGAEEEDEDAVFDEGDYDDGEVAFRSAAAPSGGGGGIRRRHPGAPGSRSAASSAQRSTGVKRARAHPSTPASATPSGSSFARSGSTSRAASSSGGTSGVRQQRWLAHDAPPSTGASSRTSAAAASAKARQERQLAMEMDGGDVDSGEEEEEEEEDGGEGGHLDSHSDGDEVEEESSAKRTRPLED